MFNNIFRMTVSNGVTYDQYKYYLYICFPGKYKTEFLYVLHISSKLVANNFEKRMSFSSNNKY